MLNPQWSSIQNHRESVLRQPVLKLATVAHIEDRSITCRNQNITGYILYSYDIIIVILSLYPYNSYLTNHNLQFCYDTPRVINETSQKA